MIPLKAWYYRLKVMAAQCDLAYLLRVSYACLILCIVLGIVLLLLRK